jgi:hypothetical protein
MVVKLAEEVLPHVSKITIIIAGTAEALTLALISDKKDKGGVAILPINIKGSAAEVEAELANAIKLVFADNKQVFSNAVEAAEAVKASANKPASLKTASSSKSKSTKKEDEEDEDKEDDEKVEEEQKKPSKLTPTQIKVQKDQKKNFDRAEKATDVDVVNFVENEIMKAYKTALMPEDVFVDLKAKFDGIRDKMGKPKEEAAATGMFAGAAEQSKQPSVAPTTEHAVKEPVVEKAAPKVEEKKPAPAPAAPAATEEEEIIF